MLTESLGRHPELYAFPGETRMIPHLIARAPAFGDLDNDDNFFRRWSYVVSSSVDFRTFNDHQPLAVPENWREHSRTLATILDATFRYFAAQHGNMRWCEKSPNNSEHILALADLYPRSKFVHIIRDGRDCAASTHRRQGRDPSLTIYRWRQTVTEARRQGNLLDGRYFELRYEDLTLDPVFWMRQICAFVHLPFDPCVTESAMPQSSDQNQYRGGRVGKIQPNSLKFLDYFNEAQLAKLETISGDFLEELGYPIFHIAGTADIGPARARFIRLIDFFKANSRLRQKLAGDSGIKWSDVYRSTLASVREYSSKRY